MELATWRFATQPLSLGGKDIAVNDPVLVVLAAADRDPERFADPDVLDLGRRDNQHLGYGHGIHYCLGAPLARLEGQTALATLLTRLPDLQLAGDPADLRWRGGLIMRGLRTLPVEFTPERAADGPGVPAEGRPPVPSTVIPPPNPKVTLLQLCDLHVISVALTCDK